MYFVNLYKDNVKFFNAPFESKQAAIKYFNTRIDSKDLKILFDFDRIELYDENICLFEYEV